MVTDYAVRPLVEVLDGSQEAVILGLTTTNFAVSTSVIPGTRIEVVAPMHPLGLARDGSFAAVGDLRLGAVVPAGTTAPKRRSPTAAKEPSRASPKGCMGATTSIRVPGMTEVETAKLVVVSPRITAS